MWEVMRSLFRVGLLIGALSVGFAPEAAAQWTRNGISPCRGEPCEGRPVGLYPDGAGGAYLFRYEQIDGSGSDVVTLHHVLARGVPDPEWPQTGLPWKKSGVISSIRAVLDGQGGLLIVTNERNVNDPRSYPLYAYRVNRNGTFPAGWDTTGVRLTRDIVSVGSEFALTQDGVGGYYLAWTEYVGGNSKSGNRIARYDQEGRVVAGWPLDGLSADTQTMRNGAPQLVSDFSGGVILVANSLSDDNVSSSAYAMRINADGTRGWPQSPDGVVLRTGPLYTTALKTVSDGAGGAYSVIYRGNHFDNLYLQRVLVNGLLAPGWPITGIPIATGPGFILTDFQGVDDAQGGAFISWTDYRTGVGQFRIQRILPNGTRALGWPDQGLVVGGAGTINVGGGIAADLQGGVYGMWEGVNSSGNYTFLTHLLSQGPPAPGWLADGLFADEDNASGLSVYPGEIIPDGRGGAIVSWERVGGGSTGVTRLQRLSPDGTVATNLTMVATEVGPDRVSIEWFTSSPDPAGYAVERQAEADVWVRIANVIADGAGHLHFEDRSVSPGRSYGYQLRSLAGGGPLAGSVAWLTTPTGPRFALDGVHPNPSRARDLRVRYSLEPSTPASLEFYDITGRRLWGRDVIAHAGGDQMLQLGDDQRLPAGLYWLRLTQGARRAMSRVVIVE